MHPDAEVLLKPNLQQLLRVGLVTFGWGRGVEEAFTQPRPHRGSPQAGLSYQPLPGQPSTQNRPRLWAPPDAEVLLKPNPQPLLKVGTVAQENIVRQEGPPTTLWDQLRFAAPEKHDEPSLANHFGQGSGRERRSFAQHFGSQGAEETTHCVGIMQALLIPSAWKFWF